MRISVETLSTPKIESSLIYHIQTPRFIVIGGRPSIGKTMFMMNIMSELDNQGELCFWFSFSETITSVKNKYKELNQYDENIYFTQSVDFGEIRKYIRDFKVRGFNYFFIDCFQLLNDAQENIYEKSSYICHELKRMSLEFNVTIVVESQLSRKCEERCGKRPILTDLRDSGTLEEDADIVFLVHRRDYYDKVDFPDRVEVILAKSRFGDEGIFFYQKNGYRLIQMEKEKNEIIDDFKPFILEPVP